MNLVIAITGASGSLYAKSFLRLLARYVPGESALVVSEAAIRVYQGEQSVQLHSPEDLLAHAFEGISPEEHKHGFTIFDTQDIGAPPASGSAPYQGMVIIPSSMRTLASIAAGISDDLIGRAADVMLKERRPLVLVPRETPYSLIHLQNMTRITEAGGIILPASPGFYHRPESLEALGDFIAARALRLVGGPHTLGPVWDGDGLFMRERGE